MDFKDLMQKMHDIEEGFESSIDECGDDMPAAIIQGGPPPAEDNLNMNVTINSKGADGIRELMNVLKGISHNEPKDIPHDDDTKLLGKEKEPDRDIVIGDDFKNAKHGDAGAHVYNIKSVLRHGNDLADKHREAVKVNGGGNPMADLNETLVNHLSSLYEDVKLRQKKR